MKAATKSPKGRKTTTTRAAAKKPVAAKKAPAPKAVVKKAAVKKPAVRAAAKKPGAATGHVLQELKSLAKELNKAARGIGKGAGGSPKEVSAILGSVERMTAEAANKSLMEAETAKQIVANTLDTLNKNWNRQDIEAALRSVGGHLTNIIVAQEFQDLAGQSLRKAMKALVGAIIVVESGGPTEDQRLSQKDVDSLLNELMP